MFSLERLEKGIIVFFAATLVLGLGVSAYRRSHLAQGVTVENFNVERYGKERLNINEATAEDLMRLSGIGKTTAGRIVDYRSAKGYFVSIDEIKKVKGVGKAVFEKIKEDISVE